MAQFKPIKCTEAQMNSKAKSEGQLFFTTDTNKIYLDKSPLLREEYCKASGDSISGLSNISIKQFNWINNSGIKTNALKITGTWRKGSVNKIQLNQEYTLGTKASFVILSAVDINTNNVGSLIYPIIKDYGDSMNFLSLSDSYLTLLIDKNTNNKLQALSFSLQGPTISSKNLEFWIKGYLVTFD